MLYTLAWKSGSRVSLAKVAEAVQGEEVRVVLVVHSAHAVIIRGTRDGHQVFPLHEPVYILKAGFSRSG